MSLLTFDVNDPSLNHVVSRPTIVRNSAGLFGAYLSGFLVDIFGVTSFIWPLVFGALGVAYISTTFELHWWRWCGYFLITLCLLTAGSAWNLGIGDVRGGGVVGRTLFKNTSLFLSPGGGALLWFFVILVAVQLSFGLSAIALVRKIFAFFHDRFLPSDFTRFKVPSLPLPKLNLGNQLKKFNNNFSLRRSTPDKSVELPEIMVDAGKGRAPAEPEPLEDEFDDIFVPHKKVIDVSPVEDKDKDKNKAKKNDDLFPFTKKNDDSFPFAKNKNDSDPGDFFASTADEEKSAAPDYNTELKPEEKPEREIKPKSRGLSSFFSKVKSKGESDNQGEESQSAASKRPLPPKAPLPGIDLLTKAEPVSHGAKVASEMEKRVVEKGRALMACLGDFGVQGDLVHITPGPVVTMFEVRPARGIKVNRIASLSDDLALGLKALAVRIQAPIPGTDTVGIEIPNDAREMVNFRELLYSDDFKKSNMALPMAVGRDISGKPMVADLTSMPHLLVAGATGAGKSVCLNSILLSLIYKMQPADMKLLLIDPKRIELAVYGDLPHLVHPVVTEMNQAKNALDWAVHEMDSRYERMARLGVRKISGYNHKLASFGDRLPANLADLEPMPFMVIIIDELADLMMTAAREVETSIVRLAQLARAAGIHMILATQRPSVDVVTGIIKANFPCRISFQVTSKHDSRTILDTVGAEHLLGKGDMLYKPSGGKIMRLHGPFVSDEDVTKVVEHWKKHLKPSYTVDFSEWGNGGDTSGNASDSGDTTQDALYNAVSDFVREQERHSISLVQRRFKIGFNRAARLLEQLEKDGVIPPPDANRPRNR